MSAIYEVPDGEKDEHLYMAPQPVTSIGHSKDKGGNSTRFNKIFQYVTLSLLLFITMLVLAVIGVSIYSLQTSEVQCTVPKLDTLILGAMVKQSYKPHDMISELTCGAGEQLVGDSSFVCQEDGTWRGTAFCKQKASFCPDNWTRYNDSCYLFVQHPREEWYPAFRKCLVLGGHLVIVETVVEHTWIQRKLKLLNPYGEEQFWTAGNDLQTHNVWVWGLYPSSRIQKTFWATSEPSDTYDGMTEDCLTYYPRKSFEWNDSPCHYPRPYICEI